MTTTLSLKMKHTRKAGSPLKDNDLENVASDYSVAKTGVYIYNNFLSQFQFTALNLVFLTKNIIT